MSISDPKPILHMELSIFLEKVKVHGSISFIFPYIVLGHVQLKQKYKIVAGHPTLLN